MPSVPEVSAQLQQVRAQLDRVILGQAKVKEHLLVCLLAGGHALLEGVPGTGKTLLGLTLAKLLGCRFRRIQFTPDLMPVDLLGTNVFNPQTQTFDFHAGPIFTDILLADEVNRTPPRTQSALLEAMQEKAATIDGTRHPISDVFLVIATQNPIEFEGTYPLPEAQRDRFLLKITIDYPKMEEEAGILEAYAGGNIAQAPTGSMASCWPKPSSPRAALRPASARRRGASTSSTSSARPGPARAQFGRARAPRWRCSRQPRAGRDPGPRPSRPTTSRAVGPVLSHRVSPRPGRDGRARA
jgi:MoxR-like ATPase